MDSLKERADRFFFSKNHKNNILDSLTIINGYFTIYNSQFDWSIRYYERLILKKYKNKKFVILDIPLLLDWLESERLDFSDFPAREYSLESINDALTDLRSGALGRMIIRMENKE